MNNAERELLFYIAEKLMLGCSVDTRWRLSSLLKDAKLSAAPEVAAADEDAKRTLNDPKSPEYKRVAARWHIFRRGATAALAIGLLSASAHAATVTTVGPQTINPLDVSTVTTGGTAVQALGPGEHAAGGFIQNPPGAAVNLCINEAGTAVGTTSNGSTVCIAAGVIYQLSPSIGPVSVVSSDSAHAFAGYGLK